jgi:hypothetical protein
VTDHSEPDVDLAKLRGDIDFLLVLLEPTLTAGLPAAAAAPTTLGAAGPPRPGLAHVWRTLTASEAARAWQTLTGWVDWLSDRYRLDDTIPSCWYRHDAMVDELDALRAAWTAAYLDPAARPAEAGLWLDQLDRTLERIRDWDRYGCVAGTHHHDTAAPGELTHDDQSREEFLFAEINTRADACDD